MAYVKNIWVDQDVERPKTYEVTNNQDGSITLTDSFGLVTELGTPVNETNMNHIEDGIDGCAIRKHNLTETFNLGEWVLGGTGDDEGIYKSLIANNVGNAITDDTKWEKVEMGGGGGLEIGDIAFTEFGVDETQNKRRVLNGQLIIQDQYTSFTSKLKQTVLLNPSLATTEANWQSEVALSPSGTCYKFVIDDEGGTIRLPKYPNYCNKNYVSMAVVGNGTVLGLTNGTSNAGIYTYSGNSNSPYISTTAYGINVGATTTDTGVSGSGRLGLGVTTDGTKSGMVVDLENAISESLAGVWFIQVATGVDESVDVTREIELNNPFCLLDYKYSEYELDNISWLRSNGQWNAKAVFPDAYDLLLKIYNGTETKAGVSVKLSTETYADTDFVLNTSDETFRLPLKVALASGKAVVGNGMSLGFTDGTTNVGFYAMTGSGYVGRVQSDSTLYGVAQGTQTGTSTGTKSLGLTTDASKSGLELSDANLYLYFYVGETVQNANLINAGRIEEKLVDKANVDLSNVNNQGKILMAHNAMPSDTYVDLTLGASDSQYVMPADGWLVINKHSSGTNQYAKLLNQSNGLVIETRGPANNTLCACYIPVKKGDTIVVGYSAGGTLECFRFIYAKGSESEAQ